jgi:hypothetical protein
MMKTESAPRTAAVILLMISFLLAVLILPARGAGKGVGQVLNLYGDWFLEANSPVRIEKGQELPAGGKIWRSLTGAEAKTAFIEVQLRNGMMWRRSSKTDRCNRREPCILPGAVEKELSWLDTIWRLLRIRTRDNDIPTYSRSGDPEEGVVRLNNGKIDLTPVFGTMEPDIYLLRFQSLDDKGEPSGRASRPILYDWEPGRPELLSGAGFRPGLYEMELLDRETSNHVPTGRTAWVLIAKPRDHERLRESFERAVMLTGEWGIDVSPYTVRAFHRAYLNALALRKIN